LLSKCSLFLAYRESIEIKVGTYGELNYFYSIPFFIAADACGHEPGQHPAKYFTLGTDPHHQVSLSIDSHFVNIPFRPVGFDLCFNEKIKECYLYI
jgi:hypothetical protein